MSRSRSRSPGENNSTVFVGNLNHDTDDRALREFFTTWGKVLETKVRFPAVPQPFNGCLPESAPGV